MAGKSNYLEAMFLNVVLRTQAAYKPAAVYVGLYTAAPSDAGGGTEVSGNSYARVQVTQADASWDAPAGTPRATQNAGVVTFPTATGTWGTLTHFGIFDASTAGNLLYWGSLTTNPTITSGMTPSFAAGQLDLSED